MRIPASAATITNTLIRVFPQGWVMGCRVFGNSPPSGQVGVGAIGAAGKMLTDIMSDIITTNNTAMISNKLRFRINYLLVSPRIIHYPNCLTYLTKKPHFFTWRLYKIDVESAIMKSS